MSDAERLAERAMESVRAWVAEGYPTSLEPMLKRIFGDNIREAQRLERERCDEERPYWLWRAMLEHCMYHDCMGTTEGDDCEESGACITEWCVPCAAKRYLDAILDAEREALLIRNAGQKGGE